MGRLAYRLGSLAAKRREAVADPPAQRFGVVAGH
jgi:hypothetical protein